MNADLPEGYHEYPIHRNDDSLHEYSLRRRIVSHALEDVFEEHQVIFLFELPCRKSSKEKKQELLELSPTGDLVVRIDERNAHIFFGDEWSVLEKSIKGATKSPSNGKVSPYQILATSLITL